MSPRTIHTRAASHAPEAAFTLLEMMVVLVLLSIASAAIFPSITSMLRSTTRGAAMTGASGDGKVAERLIEHDIRGAAGTRSKGNRTDVVTPGSSVIQALNSTSPAAHDVLTATATQLEINTEALLSSAGIERVTWQLRQNQAACGELGANGENWCVVRTVVGAGGTVSEVVTRGRGSFPAVMPAAPPGCANGVRLFCYRVAENNNYNWSGGWRPNGCTTRWTGLNSTLGGAGWINNVRHNGFDPVVRMHQLDLITEIAVVVPSGGGFGSTSERTFVTTELAIRARQGEAYQQAIMCGAR